MLTEQQLTQHFIGAISIMLIGLERNQAEMMERGGRIDISLFVEIMIDSIREDIVQNVPLGRLQDILNVAFEETLKPYNLQRGDKPPIKLAFNVRLTCNVSM